MFRTLKMIVDITTQGKEIVEFASLSLTQHSNVEILCRKNYCVIMESVKWNNSKLETISVIWPTPSGRKMVKMIYPCYRDLFIKGLIFMIAILLLITAFLILGS
ncbi:MAG: hypothetical protein WC472_01710 [Candidatus Paceibacterota bacterium]